MRGRKWVHGHVGTDGASIRTPRLLLLHVLGRVNTAEPDLQGLAPSAILRRLGLRARKGMSQSFLTDVGVCQAMAEAAGLTSVDEVLEIGPGLGILTRVLLERAGRVVAVELDRELASHLPRLAPSGTLEVINGDALAVDPLQYFANAYKLVANLPYQITSPVLTRFLVEVRRPSKLVLMVQREVAERIAAPPGQASYLSILARSVGEVRIVRRVPAGAFFPRPKVDSAVVQIAPRPAPVVPDDQLADFLRLVRAGFTQPRKTLANSLAQGLGVSRASVEPRLKSAGIDPARRPQDLSIDDWTALHRTVDSLS